MTDRQNEKLNMHQTTLNFLYENSHLYSDIPAFVRAVGELGTNVAGTKVIVGQQAGVAVKGTTAQKDGAEDVLVQACLTVAGPLYVYAFENNNTTLMEKASVNKNSFYRAHSNQALSLAKNIAGEAELVAEPLAGYGVTAAHHQALTDAIARYEALVVSPRTAINERKQHTGSLAQQLAATDSVLYDKLDNLVFRFKDTNPAFYNGYKNARSINSSYVRHRPDDNGNGNGGESPAPETE